MRERLKRIRMLVGLREREAQAHQANVRIALLAQREAVAREQEARQLIQRAEEQKRQLARGIAGAASYLELEDWLESGAIRHAMCLRELRASHQEVTRAQRGLRSAKIREAQAQALLERLQAQVGQAQLRRERQQEDETAQMVAGRKSRT